MIDALEIRVPLVAPSNAPIWGALGRRERLLKTGGYAYQSDYREEYGFFVNHGHRHPLKLANRHFRIIFDAVRLLSATEIMTNLETFLGIKTSEVSLLRVVRVDFATDVSLPVEWFRQNCFLRAKQECREYTYVNHYTREVTGLTLGKRPDRYTIYNKIKEQKDKRKQVPRTGVEGKVPSTLTRVERQCTGTGVPQALNTLGSLLERAAGFDPFEKIELLDSADMPNMDAWTAQRWLMNLGVQAAIQRYGLVATRKEANRRSKGNNILGRYMELACPTSRAITTTDLTAGYRKSTLSQLQPLAKSTAATGLLEESEPLSSWPS